MSFLATLVAAQKLRMRVIAAVTTIEALVPDDTPLPGPKKLDIALKSLLRWNAKLAGREVELTEMIADVKSIYNDVRSATEALGGQPAPA